MAYVGTMVSKPLTRNTSATESEREHTANFPVLSCSSLGGNQYYSETGAADVGKMLQVQDKSGDVLFQDACQGILEFKRVDSVDTASGLCYHSAGF